MCLGPVPGARMRDQCTAQALGATPRPGALRETEKVPPRELRDLLQGPKVVPRRGLRQNSKERRRVHVGQMYRCQWWVRRRVLREMRRRGPPARGLPGLSGMGREVPERVRDGELDPGQHEALPEVPDAHREEPGLQPYVLLAVQVRVLLDVHGRLVSRGVPFRH